MYIIRYNSYGNLYKDEASFKNDFYAAIISKKFGRNGLNTLNKTYEIVKNDWISKKPITKTEHKSKPKSHKKTIPFKYGR